MYYNDSNEADCDVCFDMEGNFLPKRGTDESIVCLSRESAKHPMKLHSQPFEMIKSGRKTIELRLWDEKRQRIRIGDTIVFTNTISGETLQVTVKKLHRFDSFEELYKELPLLKCGYTQEDIATAQASDMEAYYCAEEQAKYGVVGIELHPIQMNCRRDSCVPNEGANGE